MKFTDGNWMMREGVKAHYAAEAYQVSSDGKSLRIVAPATHIRHRGDTLGGPVLTVRISSPLKDVIRVRATHFEGGQDRGPHFEVADTDPQVVIDDLSISSGKLTAKVDRANWRIDFEANGKLLAQSPNRGLAYMQVAGEGAFMVDQLTLVTGECVYGLGERFTAFVKNGQTVETWNRDGGTSSDQAYKNVPFYLTNRGYGVFVNHPGAVSFEVGSEKVGRVQFSVPGEEIEYLVIYGPTPKEILTKYTALTGRPALPPPWSFGLWLSTSFTTNYDEATVNDFIQGMADRDVPLSVFHYDCFWMRGFNWTDLTWDPDTFPDPKGMLQRLHERGLRVCAWINPYIAQESRLFTEGKQNGYLLKRPSGDVWQWDMWQPGMAIVDFTNPAARSWFKEKLGEILDMGVDSLKTDFGERIPTDVAWHDGSDPHRMHNYYSQIYNEAVFELLEEKRGKGEAVVFARAATAGGQKFPVHWGGDCWSTFEAMSESLRGGLSLCLSGFGYWSHDIGGFEGLPPAELYKRWVAFGLLSSHSRLHASTSYRVPWLFDEEAVEVLRSFTKLKCRLMPYLWSKALEAHEQGIPMMRAMHLEFPNDPACLYLDRQYMLGESLLVAPVFTSEGEVEFYVPEGKWTSLIVDNRSCASGLQGGVQTYQGPGWFKETHGFLTLPLLVPPNTLLPLGAEAGRPDYDYLDGVMFGLCELTDGVTATRELRSTDGRSAKVTATRRGTTIDLAVQGTLTNWTLLLVNAKGVRSDFPTEEHHLGHGWIVHIPDDQRQFSIEEIP